MSYLPTAISAVGSFCTTPPAAFSSSTHGSLSGAPAAAKVNGVWPNCQTQYSERAGQALTACRENWCHGLRKGRTRLIALTSAFASRSNLAISVRRKAQAWCSAVFPICDHTHAACRPSHALHRLCTRGEGEGVTTHRLLDNGHRAPCRDERLEFFGVAQPDGIVHLHPGHRRADGRRERAVTAAAAELQDRRPPDDHSSVCNRGLRPRVSHTNLGTNSPL